ncbi:MAG: SDR family oxidoreductase [Leptolyngbyaceae cyanobacterium T60_A2020_046]|nr:SDR family oxidoreductase [Leptolyngbyaceae cyanobacterium T60_A2020_046]
MVARQAPGGLNYPQTSAIVNHDSGAANGVVRLTKAAALEFAEQNTRINTVCPGPIMTPMLQRLMTNTPGFEERVCRGARKTHWRPKGSGGYDSLSLL